jgi:hypothetical protein
MDRYYTSFKKFLNFLIRVRYNQDCFTVDDYNPSAGNRQHTRADKYIQENRRKYLDKQDGLDYDLSGLPNTRDLCKDISPTVANELFDSVASAGVETLSDKDVGGIVQKLIESRRSVVRSV